MAPVEFVLKDSPQELIDAKPSIKPKGRHYNEEKANEPGGVKIEDLLLGMKLACLASTDDEEDTLKKVEESGSAMHVEVLAMISGSVEEAYKPLSYLLDTYMDGLKVDKIINEQDWATVHPIDTQGYIAHNDKIIVLAFRGTDTKENNYDWITDFQMNTSSWQPKEDVVRGQSENSGRINVKGFFAKKARVHTGFYHNILRVIPIIKDIIDPMLLDSDQPPRKLYVVGYSLGAGLATLAAAYLLTEYKWEDMPHKLININFATPRSCNKEMHDMLIPRMQELRKLDKLVMCRILLNADFIIDFPPQTLNYRYVEKLVYLSEDFKILIGPSYTGKNYLTIKHVKMLQQKTSKLFRKNSGTDDAEEDDDEEGEDYRKEWKLGEEYKKSMMSTPRPTHHHYPDFYLARLLKCIERYEQDCGC